MKDWRRKIPQQLLVYLVLIILPIAVQAQKTIKVKNIDKEIAHLPPEVKADVYLQTYEYFVQKDHLRAITYNQKAFEILKLMPHGLRLGICYFNFGYVERIKGNYDEALKNLNIGIELFKKVNGELGLAFSYNNIGIIHKNRREFVEAMEYFNMALKLCRKLNHKTEMANIINNIGNIYMEQEDYPNAIENFEKCLTYQKADDYML